MSFIYKLCFLAMIHYCWANWVTAHIGGTDLQGSKWRPASSNPPLCPLLPDPESTQSQVTDPGSTHSQPCGPGSLPTRFDLFGSHPTFPNPGPSLGLLLVQGKPTQSRGVGHMQQKCLSVETRSFLLGLPRDEGLQMPCGPCIF